MSKLIKLNSFSYVDMRTKILIGAKMNSNFDTESN